VDVGNPVSDAERGDTPGESGNTTKDPVWIIAGIAFFIGTWLEKGWDWFPVDSSPHPCTRPWIIYRLPLSFLIHWVFMP